MKNGRTYAFQVRPYTTAAQTALLEASAFPTVSDGWGNISGSDADTASHAITHLANGKQYKVKLRALNSAKPDGVGPESDSDTFATAPAKPAGFKAAGGSAQTTLTWDDPKNSTINQWQTRQRANGKGQADFIVGSGSIGQKITLEWTASSAANITKWQYREKAGTANWGAWTDICATTSNADCPATTAHTITTSTALTDGTHYAYQVQATVSTGTAPTVTNLKAWETVKTGATDTTHTVTDLVNGVAYRFQLRAANAAGAGAPANEITSSTDPAPPASLTAEPGNQMVILTWDDPNDPSITAYQYQQKTTGNWGAVWTDIDGSGASTASYTKTGLINGTAYTFRIRAANRDSAGDRFSAASNEIAATPLDAPSQPTGLTVSITGAAASLSWDATDDTDVKTWQHRQKASSDSAWGAWTAIQGSNASTNSLTVAGLDAGKTYYFRVRIVNTNDAAGPGSEIASAATPPLKPTGLSASAGYQQATLSWDDPQYPSITKWQYQQREVGQGGLTAVPGNAQAVLSWTNPNDSAITKWQYRKQESGQAYGDWTDVPSSSAATTTYTVTGLTNGTTYAFEVRAFKTAGEAALDEVSATPTLDDGYADMSPSNAATRTFNVTSLDSDKTYAFKVRAVNPAGSSPASDETTVALPATPGEPQNLTATKKYNEGSNNFTGTLKWTVAKADDTIIRWQYRAAPLKDEQGNDTDLNAINWDDVPNSHKDTRKYDVPDLTSSFKFQIRAVNTSGGGAASAIATLSLTPAAPALSEIADVVYDSTARGFDVTIEWADPADASIKRWQYRGADGEPDDTDATWAAELEKATWRHISGGDKDTRDHTLEDLSQKAYRFQIRAANVAGLRLGVQRRTGSPAAQGYRRLPRRSVPRLIRRSRARMDGARRQRFPHRLPVPPNRRRPSRHRRRRKSHAPMARPRRPGCNQVAVQKEGGNQRLRRLGRIYP